MPALLCALFVATPNPGLSDPTPAAPGRCPDADVVWAGVTALVGAARLPPVDKRPTLQIDDLGARYRVAIAGRAREVVDETRDCGRRAQVAAVFVALTLAPPEGPAPDAPTPPPAPPLPPRLPVRLEAAPTLGANLLATPDRAAFVGGLARVALGGGRVAALAGVGATFGARADDAPGRVRERRVSADAGARLGWRGRRIDAGLDVEAVVGWLQIAPSGGASTGTLDVGGRLGGIVAFGHGRIMPILGFSIDISALPRALAFEPDGVVGHASWLRASGFAGVALRLGP
ncbi:MAG TPA: hypothetical protein VH560_12705 [Polyangia bacterium]|nr:hypothetical protein [Polyangia bacterium]